MLSECFVKPHSPLFFLLNVGAPCTPPLDARADEGERTAVSGDVGGREGRREGAGAVRVEEVEGIGPSSDMRGENRIGWGKEERETRSRQRMQKNNEEK